jgi:hypothetical protein
MPPCLQRTDQDPAYLSVTCDPEDAPTVDFINANKELYYNANITTLAEAGYSYNQNSIIDDCT